MRKQIVQEIEDSLNHMEETGVVELSILDSLKKLRDWLASLKSKWIENPDTDGFYFYQAARNVEMITERMESRFQNSKIAGDIPKIAGDSLILLPIMNRVLEVADTTTKVSQQSIASVLEHTRDLRNTASGVDLIEPIEVSRESMDKDNLRLQFTELMKSLDSVSQN